MHRLAQALRTSALTLDLCALLPGGDAPSVWRTTTVQDALAQPARQNGTD
jgi:hypothetical protein